MKPYGVDRRWIAWDIFCCKDKPSCHRAYVKIGHRKERHNVKQSLRIDKYRKDSYE